MARAAGRLGLDGCGIGTLVIASVFGFVPAVSAGSNTNPPPASVAPYVSHGPMLGRLEPDGVAVWARTSRPASFHVRFGTTRTLMVRQSETASTRLANDNAGWVRLKGLEPDTIYYYRVVVDDGEGVGSDVFQFRTMPSAEQTTGLLNPDGLFNFAFTAVSCAKQSPTESQGLLPYATLFRQGADQALFHVVLGDWMYEQDRRKDANAWLVESGGPGAEMPELLNVAPNLAGAWQNYKTYFDNDPNLRRWHAAVPSFFLFDDHEVLNNFQDAAVPGHGARNSLFRDPALRAWRDYLGWSNPEPDPRKIHFGRARLNADSPLLHDTEADFTKLELTGDQTLHVHWGGADAGYRNTDAVNRSAIAAAINALGPQDPNAAVYKIERVVDAHTLELGPTPKHSGDSAYSIGGLDYYFSQRIANAELIALDTRTHRQSPLVSDTPTMLGRTQTDWFLQRLKDSSADLIFVLSSVSFVIPHTSRSELGTDDQSWSGYPRERAELFDAIEATGKTVILLTGDLHNAFSVQISDRLWEFSVGPMGSLNRAIGQPDRSGVPSNGPYTSAGLETAIRWSTHFLADTPVQQRRTPVYTMVRLNNVFNSHDPEGRSRWVAFDKPQVVVQFYNANNGQLLHADSVLVGPSATMQP